MNVQIVSASKKSESVFESPLSSTVLTREEIERSGALSLEELFQLVPGFIVRQTTNGNFDVHIRGNDNVPPGNMIYYSFNSLTLVMIDNRPVYNYFNGGTFWENLSIDLNDIDRIEIIRGPSSALYGPNAVSGAVNIITRKVGDQKVTADADVQTGNAGTFKAMAGAGFRLSDKWSGRVSGNFSRFDRFDDQYYSYEPQAYLTTDSLRGQIGDSIYSLRYPDPELAKLKSAVNFAVNYAPRDNVSLDLAAGMLSARVQAIGTETLITPISTRNSDLGHIDLRGQIYGFQIQANLLAGRQNIFEGQKGFEVDLTNTNIVAEYDYTLGKLNLRPGVSYQGATYDDSPYVDVSKKAGFLNGKQTLTNLAGFIRADYKATDKLRFIAALRADKYNNPEKLYLSYQLIGSYAFNENNIIRAVFSKANRSPFLADYYTNYQQYSTFNQFEGNSYNGRSFSYYNGNKNLDLLTMYMAEIGYRTKLTQWLQADIEGFYTTTSNYATINYDSTKIEAFPPLLSLYNYLNYNNMQLSSEQTGASISLTIIAGKALQLRLFGTIQQTTLRNLESITTTATA